MKPLQPRQQPAISGLNLRGRVVPSLGVILTSDWGASVCLHAFYMTGPYYVKGHNCSPLSKWPPSAKELCAEFKLAP